MTQLIIDGIALPETHYDRYASYPAEIGTQIDMISGRRVTEIRGHVQMIHYEYDYFNDSLWRSVAAVLRSGLPFTAVYLPDDDSDMISSTFVCENMANPTFAFAKNGLAYWHGIDFTLRELSPHD